MYEKVIPPADSLLPNLSAGAQGGLSPLLTRRRVTNPRMLG